MAIVTTRVQIFEARIQTHFEPGGAVAKDAVSVARTAVILAKSRAPKRTGFLASTITFGTSPRGRLSFGISVGAYADYATYVENGTVGPILPTHARALALPAYGFWPATRQPYVAGQRAQHFIRRSMNESLESHGYRGIAG